MHLADGTEYEFDAVGLATGFRRTRRHTSAWAPPASPT